MIRTKDQYSTIDAYIAAQPRKVRDTLITLRRVIQEEAPGAIETITYRMPTYVLHGNLVHFAAFTHHIGLYPTPSAIEAFRKDLIPYKTSKGAIQFPLNKPLPITLIRKIVAFRVKEMKEKKKK